MRRDLVGILGGGGCGVREREVNCDHFPLVRLLKMLKPACMPSFSPAMLAISAIPTRHLRPSANFFGMARLVTNNFIFPILAFSLRLSPCFFSRKESKGRAFPCSVLAPCSSSDVVPCHRGHGDSFCLS